MDKDIQEAASAAEHLLDAHKNSLKNSETQEALQEIPFQTQTVAFKVRRHVLSSLTTEEARKILAGGVNLLATDNGPDGKGHNDVSCAVALVVDGEVETFTGGDGVIRGHEELDAICESAGRVLVFNEIRFCHHMEGLGKLYGCACSSTQRFLVVRTDEDEESSLWMHEYGHNCRLEHRSTSGTLMNKVLSANNTRIDAGECSLLQGAHFDIFIDSTPIIENDLNILEFIRQKFIHGVPYERAAQFGSEVVPILLEVLADQKQVRYWANAVAVLCSIGDTRAVNPLLTLILSGKGAIDRAEYEAKVTAIAGLGAILHKNFDSIAYEFLVKALNSDEWAERVEWNVPYNLNREEHLLHLRKLVVEGLALSGTPQAGQALSELLTVEWKNIQEQGQSVLLSFVLECQLRHARIFQNGLAAYYAPEGASW